MHSCISICSCIFSIFFFVSFAYFPPPLSVPSLISFYSFDLSGLSSASSTPAPTDSDSSWFATSDSESSYFSLTRTQRLWGFFFFFVLGWLLSLLSIIALPQISVHPQKFALLYTVGNIVSLTSTALLWGPGKQIREMFAPVRIGGLRVRSGEPRGVRISGSRGRGGRGQT